MSKIAKIKEIVDRGGTLSPKAGEYMLWYLEQIAFVSDLRSRCANVQPMQNRGEVNAGWRILDLLKEFDSDAITRAEYDRNFQFWKNECNKFLSKE